MCTCGLGVTSRLLLTKLVQAIPEPIKRILKKMGLGALLPLVKNKYSEALLFQIEWVDEFRDGKSKVLEYWRKYRYLDDITRICEITDASRVLDVGCGISTVLHYVRGERLGIDPLANEYMKLYDYPAGIRVRRGWGENIPFPNDSFDIVFCSNALDHTTDPPRTVGEICRVLDRGGYFVLTVEIFDSDVERDLAHPHSFTRKELHCLLEKRFKVVFERESPWISLRGYVHGKKDSENRELVMILKKRDS